MSVGLIKAPASTCFVDRFTHDMTYRGPVEYISVEVTHDWWDTMTGTLVISSDSPDAPAIRLAAPLPARKVGGVAQAATLGDVIPIDVTVNGVRWSGRVDGWTEEKVNGAWQMTVGLLHESEWAGEFLCWPNTAGPLTAQFPQQDFQSAPAGRLVRSYMSRNLTRLYGGSAPVVVVPDVGQDTGDQFQLAARMTYPRDLFKEMLKVAGVSVQVTRWRVGDPQPPGLTLTQPTVVVDVVSGRDRPWVVWKDSDGGLTDPKLAGNAPRAHTVITGGRSPDLVNNALQQISGLSFFANVFAAFQSLTNDAGKAAWGPFAFPEAFANSGSGAFTLQALQAGRAALKDNAGSFSATGTVVDGVPWRFGDHYLLGDFVFLGIRGTEYQQQIRSITVGAARDKKVYARPIVGDKPTDEDPFDKALRQVSSLITWVTAMNLGS